jgi:hypothetical protein
MNSVHGQVERSSARDVVPLADLQQLTDDFQAYTVHGLVVGPARSPVSSRPSSSSCS